MRVLTLILSIVAVVSANAQSWGWKKVKGNGDIKKEVRITEAYDKISVAGALDVQLFAGEEGKVTIEAEENLIQYIVTENKGDKLVIKVEDGYSIYPSRGKKIHITVPYKDIEGVFLAGSGDVNIRENDVINAKKFVASVAGSGDVNLAVNSDAVNATIAGSGDVKLSGNTSTFSCKIAGSGDIYAYDLKSEDVDVNVAGSGDAKVHCDGFLKVKIVGSGDVTYKGTPQKEESKTIGSGNITRG